MSELKCATVAADEVIGTYDRSTPVVYVSGPITTGYLKDLPFAERLNANCRVLGRWAEKAADWFPSDRAFINPATHQEFGDMQWPPEAWDDMWRRVIETLRVTDAVLTPGWSESNGCRHEIRVMLDKGVVFWQATDVGPILLPTMIVDEIVNS